MFGVVEADVDPQQVSIYTTHKAAMINTYNHTAFGMGLEPRRLERKNRTQMERRRQSGSVLLSRQAEFLRQRPTCGQLSTTTQHNQTISLCRIIGW